MNSIFFLDLYKKTFFLDEITLPQAEKWFKDFNDSWKRLNDETINIKETFSELITFRKKTDYLFNVEQIEEFKHYDIYRALKTNWYVRANNIDYDYIFEYDGKWYILVPIEETTQTEKKNLMCRLYVRRSEDLPIDRDYLLDRFGKIFVRRDNDTDELPYPSRQPFFSPSIANVFLCDVPNDKLLSAVYNEHVNHMILTYVRETNEQSADYYIPIFFSFSDVLMETCTLIPLRWKNECKHFFVNFEVFIYWRAKESYKFQVIRRNTCNEFNSFKSKNSLESRIDFLPRLELDDTFIKIPSQNLQFDRVTWASQDQLESFVKFVLEKYDIQLHKNSNRQNLFLVNKCAKFIIHMRLFPPQQ